MVYVYLTMFRALWALLVLCAVYWRLRRPKHKDPPALSGYLPIIGHIHLVIGGNDRIINVIKRGTEESVAKGNALSFWMGPKPLYVVTDPDDCLKVANTCLNTNYPFAHEVFGNGLLTCPATQWKERRKLLSPAFSHQVLDEFIPIFNQQSRRLVETFRDKVGKGYFNNQPYIRKNTLQTICLTAMGVDVTEQSESNHQYLESIDRIMGVFVERFMNPWLHFDFIYAFSNLKKKQESYLKAFHEMSAKVLKKKKSQLKLKPTSTTKTKQKSFIDLLLEDRVFTDLVIKEEVDTFMAAGHETVGTLVVFLLVLIGSFPDVQERIVDEFKLLFENREKDEDLRRQDLSRLYYLEAVIKETLRYYSLVPFVVRDLDRDVQLKNYTLRSGRPCMLLLYALHRHPMWGADAQEFRPERWLEPATLPRHPAAFAGFSIGRRTCIGQSFAMMSIKTIVVHLLRHYHIRSDHRNLRLKVDFVFRPSKGYYISLEKREYLHEISNKM